MHCVSMVVFILLFVPCLNVLCSSMYMQFDYQPDTDVTPLVTKLHDELLQLQRNLSNLSTVYEAYVMASRWV